MLTATPYAGRVRVALADGTAVLVSLSFDGDQWRVTDYEGDA